MSDQPPRRFRDMDTVELEARRDAITRAMLGGVRPIPYYDGPSLPRPPRLRRTIAPLPPARTPTVVVRAWPFWTGVAVGWLITRRRQRA